MRRDNLSRRQTLKENKKGLAKRVYLFRLISSDSIWSVTVMIFEFA